LSLPGVRVLGVARHSRKLKRGALTGNRFELALRQINGDRERAAALIEMLERLGAPNYFGEQRFGHGGSNLDRARRLFAGARMDRQQRAFALSAARSEIFNAVLAERVFDGSWQHPLAGELCILEGRRTYFGPCIPDPELLERCAAGEVHPSGPLWGRGLLPSADACAALESRMVAGFGDFTRGLERAEMDQERRSLRMFARDFGHEWEDDCLRLRFELPAGTYATSFVRELMAVVA